MNRGVVALAAGAALALAPGPAVAQELPLALRVAGGPVAVFGGGSGPGVTAGLAVSLEAVPRPRLHAGVGFTLQLGGSPERDTFLSEAGVEGRVAWLPGAPLLGAGPTVGVGLAWVRVAANKADGERGAVSLPGLRLTPGVELRLGGDGPNLSLAVTADLRPLRVQARRRSDGARLHDSGVAGFAVAVGVRFPLPSALPVADPEPEDAEAPTPPVLPR